MSPWPCFSQAADTAPPTLVNFGFSPAAIDVTESTQQVVVMLEVTDDVSGVRSLGVTFTSRSGQTQVQFGHLVAVDRLNGMWQAEMNFVPFVEGGVWEASIWFMEDLAENEIRPNAAALRDMGFPTQLAVT